MINQFFQLVLGFIGGFFLVLIINQILYLALLYWKQFKIYKTQKKIYDEMKAKGESHHWIEIELPSYLSKTLGYDSVLVCDKSGWCPTINQFINLKYVELSKKQKEAKKKEEQITHQYAKKIFDLVDKGTTLDYLKDLLKEYVDDLTKSYFDNASYLYLKSDKNKKSSSVSPNSTNTGDKK